MTFNKCTNCNSEFKVYPSVIKRQQGKFCSRQCQHGYGKSDLTIKRMKIAALKRYSDGVVAGWTKMWNNKPTKNTAENNYQWAGSSVKYRALHSWVQRQLGKPDKCNQCDKSNLSGRQIHWANISQQYRRDVTDWIRLCAKCHKSYDTGRLILTPQP